MSKGQDSRKTAKKPPKHTAKEKRQIKMEKKNNKK